MNKWHSYASEELLAWLLEENYPSVRYDTLTDPRQSGVASQAYNTAGRFCTELVRADGTILLSAGQPSLLHLLQKSEELEDGGFFVNTTPKIGGEGSRKSFHALQAILCRP